MCLYCEQQLELFGITIKWLTMKFLDQVQQTLTATGTMLKVLLGLLGHQGFLLCGCTLLGGCCFYLVDMIQSLKGCLQPPMLDGQQARPRNIFTSAFILTGCLFFSSPLGASIRQRAAEMVSAEMKILGFSWARVQSSS